MEMPIADRLEKQRTLRDGAVIQTMELSDQTSLTFRETVVSTTSKGVKLTAKVTDVEEQG
ncbi:MULTISPECIES: hypothetical protein [unclassified Streptomyces]|uniref:hypothetical protein n=1 Tax=unclassified Streptomyces TaxID=2593676 RepID=UPI0035E30CD7